MKIQKKNGFALVLSLVLLLVMSLLGGSLIVITSGDHSSNNTSDQYQQAFYVAETGLIEAEKAIVNEYLGPWINLANLDAIQASMTQEEKDAHNEYVAANTVDGSHFRDKDNRSMPGNDIDINETPCFKSFRNIVIPEELLICDRFESQIKGTLHPKTLNYVDFVVCSSREVENYLNSNSKNVQLIDIINPRLCQSTIEKNCTKYYFVWSIGSPKLQQQFVKDLKNTTFIIDDNRKNSNEYSPHLRLPIVNLLIFIQILLFQVIYTLKF